MFSLYFGSGSHRSQPALLPSELPEHPAAIRSRKTCRNQPRPTMAKSSNTAFSAYKDMRYQTNARNRRSLTSRRSCPGPERLTSSAGTTRIRSRHLNSAAQSERPVLIATGITRPSQLNDLICKSRNVLPGKRAKVSGDLERIAAEAPLQCRRRRHANISQLALDKYCRWQLCDAAPGWRPAAGLFAANVFCS